jgi:serine/threonine protein kinase
VEKVIQPWSHHQTAFAIGAVVVLVFALLVLVLLVIRVGRRKPGEKIDRKLADDLAKGNHEAAAERELEAGHLRAACDLFVRARQPMRAAQIAVRLGCLQEAAELFEKAGSRRRAADLYNQAGMKMKAEELLAEEERVAREREEQKAALRKRLEAEPEEDVASLDRSPPPARLVRSASALGDVAAASRERELNPASAPSPETPSRVASPPPRGADHRARPSAASGGQVGGPEPRAGELSQGSPVSVFGIHALVNQAVEKATSQELALAPTQASMASFAAAFDKSIASRGVEQEDLALRYVADSAVSEARHGPAIEDLQRALAARGEDRRAEDTLYQLGLALVGAGRWHEARDAFARAEQATPGYRDAAARAQELARWQGAVGKTELSLARADGKTTRYTLLGELGRGGMAVVYRVRDEALGREVALKFMAEGLGNDPEAVALFQREASAAAQLSHRNLVTLYDVGEQDGKTFICMELVEGNTVEKLLEKEGPLPTAWAAAIIDQVLEALEFAHGKQVLHRDIKPANIMLTRDGKVKVMDFGLAKRTQGPDQTTLVAGSPPYMAPEQLAGKNLDGRTDLFAVGASLYEMLTGQLPFPGPARLEPPPPMRSLNPEIPVALDAVVLRALAFDKEKRFTSAVEMAIPLRAFLKTAGPVRLGTVSVAGLPTLPALGSPATPAPPPSEAPSLDEAKPVLEELSFGDAKPAKSDLLVDSPPPTPEPPAAIVEGLPEAAPRAARTTPRTPIPVVGPSIGAYRMVRPSEPEVFTPPPSLRPAAGEGAKSRLAQWPRPASGEHPSGERRLPTPTPRLALATKLGTGESPSPRTRTPAGSTPPLPDGTAPRPATPPPVPRPGPQGTVVGIGPGRPGK